MNCYNRPNAFYVPMIEEPIIPLPAEVGGRHGGSCGVVPVMMEVSLVPIPRNVGRPHRLVKKYNASQGPEMKVSTR
jgi:hypothetical protein